MGYIYKITNNLNHKSYIGKTTYTIDHRFKQHINNAKTREDLAHLPLYMAMNKYGIDNFSIEEVEQVSDNDLLSQREIYYIEKYDTYLNGYNATKGGDGALLYDYDEIWKLWDEEKLSIKQIADKIGCNDFTVRSCLTSHNVPTEERIERGANDGNSKTKQQVLQIDPETQQIINTYNSIAEASKKVGCDSSRISKVCRGKGKTCGGYIWQYLGEPETKRDFSKKAVLQIDLKTGEVLNTYPSISEAARAVSGDSSYISKVCRGVQKSSKGFGWKFSPA